LLFHPDLLLKSNLSEKMDGYTYFSYEVTEALHLSKKEELELLLNYCVRFYDRQFYTRTNLNSDFVSDFELKLKAYFNSELIVDKGLPTANYFGNKLNMSSNYLSDLLKKETGKSIKEHIDSYIIRKAKNILLNSNNSISEIAYGLGFEYPQSFTRMFKKKTGKSPNEYRMMN